VRTSSQCRGVCSGGTPTGATSKRKLEGDLGGDTVRREDSSESRKKERGPNLRGPSLVNVDGEQKRPGEQPPEREKD